MGLKFILDGCDGVKAVFVVLAGYAFEFVLQASVPFDVFVHAYLELIVYDPSEEFDFSC
ncbi:hypothetical protein P872_20575 [Rhodonellum psychrophilum GCM71 = DSM 17998]|uniref:Uncharacterized protein n=2 Tax=Rhodonellum TaxID=336827 RepID=U5BWX0_9BACT|nr:MULTISPECIES: hypothetical protein [Rhodonellum]ERM81121.1 hypothetical protein P872_20575 [Rhodonellum psychrophilum GCM71 = DSM 17998]SDZ51560.1 hypothetical protein SAMN05444412_11940 [Rhodonellum ikkaensis]